MGLVENRAALAWVRAAAAAGTGACWSGPLWTMAAVPAIGLLWLQTPTRTQAAMVPFVYYLVALRPVAGAAPGYFGFGAAGGYLVWGLWAGVLTAPWWALWSPVARENCAVALVRLGTLYAVLALPLLGWISVGHPLVAAGVWAPRSGLLGLGLATLLTAIATTRKGLGVLVFVAVWSALHVEPPAPPAGWAGVRTRWEVFSTTDFARQFDAAWDTTSQIDARKVVQVLPEGVGGGWSPASERLWRRSVPPATRVLIGATEQVIAGPDMGRYDKLAFVLGQPVAYRQRVPLPVAEWAPWRGGDARAHWFDSGVMQIAERRAGMLLCYEQLLVLPALQSGLQGAEVFVGMSNLGWLADDDQVERAQRNALSAWGLLFDVPVAYAVNVRRKG